MRPALLTLSLVALATAAVPAQAGPAVPGPAGPTCGLVSTIDPVTPPFDYGVLFAGPLTGSGTVKCSIQVGGATHADPDTDSRSASSAGQVVLQPTPVSFDAPPLVPVYLCTQWTPTASTPVYWHSTGSGTGHWSSSATSPCVLARMAGTDDPIFDTAHDALELLAPLLCPLLPLVPDVPPVLSTTGGDLYLFSLRLVDCPPYAGGSVLPTVPLTVVVPDVATG